MTSSSANADALQRIKATGDDLTCVRDVDFTIVFTSEGAAKQFAEHFHSLGHRTSADFSETVEGFPWEVVVVKRMVLSLEEIQQFEDTLQGFAETLGGHNDGWGCFSGTSTT